MRLNKPLEWAVIAMLLCMAASPALAQHNLLENPRFNEDLSGWQNFYARPAQWRARDAENSGESGSALLGNDFVSTGSTPIVLQQCVQTKPDTEYSWGAEFRVPPAQPEGTRGDIYLSAYSTTDCSGSGELIRVFINGASVEAWSLGAGSAVTGSDAHSISIALGVGKPDGVAELASVNFDNLFLVEGPVPDGFGIEPANSTVWFNPAESGHGVMLQLISAGQAWMCWFNFDLDGQRSWVCGLGSIDGGLLSFDNAFYVQGGRFPPLFDPDLIEELPWGSITIEFSGCDSGEMTWTTTEPGYTSGSMPLQRLVGLWGNECFDFGRLGPG